MASLRVTLVVASVVVALQCSVSVDASSPRDDMLETASGALRGIAKVLQEQQETQIQILEILNRHEDILATGFVDVIGHIKNIYNMSEENNVQRHTYVQEQFEDILEKAFRQWLTTVVGFQEVMKQLGNLDGNAPPTPRPTLGALSLADLFGIFGQTRSQRNQTEHSPVSIRLADGPRDGQGRVEVRYNGAWGTVCDDSWSQNAAKVVCRQLGYSSVGAVAKTGAFFGPGDGTIWMDDVRCTGSELNLGSCNHNGWGVENCGHNEDAGVICGTTTQSHTIRLEGGSNAREGRVEVLYNDRWGSVCDDSWSTTDAEVVCRQLGFSSVGAVAKRVAYFGEGTGEIWLDDVECGGGEERLEDCSHAGWGIDNCSHSEDAGVICQP